MRRLLTTLTIAALLLAGTIWALGGGRPILASALVGYWSAALVVLASFQSYRRMVRKRLEAGMVPQVQSDRDTIDRIEDPFGLYDEEEPSKGEEEQNLRETIRQEKARMKKSRRSAVDTARDAAPAFSFWRLGAYGVLALGFFWLRGQGLLALGAYLPSLAFPIVLAVWSLMRSESMDAASS